MASASSSAWCGRCAKSLPIPQGKEKILSIAKVLRRRNRESWEEVDRIAASVIDVTQAVVEQAHTVVEKIRNAGKRTVEQSQERLQATITLAEKLIHQARQVVSGMRTIPDRIVSFFDPQPGRSRKAS